MVSRKSKTSVDGSDELVFLHALRVDSVARGVDLEALDAMIK